MRFLFIISNLRVGGNEFYLINLANNLVKKGYSVSVIYLGNADKIKVLNKFLESVNVAHGSYFSSTLIRGLYKLLTKVHPQLFIIFSPFIKIKNKYDFIHTFDCESLDIALNNFHFTRITSGIYHSKEFSWSSKLSYRIDQLKRYKSIPASNIFATKKSIIKSLNKNFYGNYSDSSIFDLCVDFKRIRKTRKNRVVIAGRLVQFKTYIEHVLSGWNEIDNNNYELLIIGDGSLKEKLISKYNKYSNISFIDEVEYHELNEILCESKIFIGSGTSLILSALCGCLPIIGLENDDIGLTPKTLADCNELSFFYNKKNKYFSLNKYLESVLHLSGNDYSLLQRKNLNESKRFEVSSHIDKFINFVKLSEPIKTKHKIKFLPIISLLAFDVLRVNNDFRNRYEN